MKKFITLASLVLIVSANVQAQSMKVIKTDGTVYEFRTDEVHSVEFEPGDGRLTENGYEYVDLGLPSGTMWATCNVGATKPEEAGDYFSWGEVTPKENYTSLTYLWGTSNQTDGEDYEQLTVITKYNTNPALGLPDNRTVLEPEDDAATVNMGGAWRMPTAEDLDELLSQCYYQITKVNGVRGLKFIGSNGNTLFLPCVGLRYGEIMMFNDVAMKWGFYWTSTLGTDPQMGCYLYTDGENKNGESFRFYGQSVRGVFVKD